MRLSLALLPLIGCHAVIAVEPPPIPTSGPTAILFRSSAGVLSASVFDGGAAIAPEAFERNGDVELALVEFKCPPGALDLAPGSTRLLATPAERSALPPPTEIHTMTLRGDDASAWTKASLPWVDAAIRSLDVGADVRCRLRGYTFDELRIPSNQTRMSLIPLRDGRTILIRPPELGVIGADGRVSVLSTAIPTLTPTTAAWGLEYEPGELITIDNMGRVHRGEVEDDGPLEAVTATIPGTAPNPLFVQTRYETIHRDGRGTLWFGSGVFTSDVPYQLATYDLARSRWTRILRGPENMGRGLLRYLPTERSLLVAGADFFLNNELAPRGEGRLLELDTSATATATWITLPAPDAGLRMVALTVAETRRFGRVVAGIACAGAAGAPCSPETGGKGRMMRQVGDTWQLVPEVDLPFSIVLVSDTDDDDALWIGGRTFVAGVSAYFEDRLVCPLTRPSATATEVVRIADGVWVTGDPHLLQLSSEGLNIFTRREARHECDE